ncbi:GTPase Era [Facklamia languida]|uniref:GTPase Era n=1 Tax=Facklamia languida CCUG 37842 TaxID=883113 RepID=H3NKA0_9LACT|nr:GTPase Era [Facklamia languida]EHR36617.1 GTP-binding protein Era [Facklamia languida CCUG 37842]
MENKGFKSGFVTLIGRPNVGKSTLMNQIIGQKIAIMSDKAQTTRNKIQGVYTRPDAQIVFMDTPGVHKPKHALGDFMVKTAYSAIQGVDAVLVLVNAAEKMGPGDRFVLDRVRDLKIPVCLVVNKIDLIDKTQLMPIIDQYTQEYPFDEVFPISALTGESVDRLLERLVELMPQGPQYYPADQVVDHPEYFLVSELIREQVLFRTREEVPHSVAVSVQSMQKNEEDEVEVLATIIVERKSQKGILIGAQGKMIKEIKRGAKREIEALLGSKVYLDLWVKVQKNWRDRQSQLNDFGYRPDDY